MIVEAPKQGESLQHLVDGMSSCLLGRRARFWPNSPSSHLACAAGLSNDVAYRVQVVAKNDAGEEESARRHTSSHDLRRSLEIIIRVTRIHLTSGITPVYPGVDIRAAL